MAGRDLLLRAQPLLPDNPDPSLQFGGRVAVALESLPAPVPGGTRRPGVALGAERGLRSFPEGYERYENTHTSFPALGSFSISALVDPSLGPGVSAEQQLLQQGSYANASVALDIRLLRDGSLRVTWAAGSLTSAPAEFITGRNASFALVVDAYNFEVVLYLSGRRAAQDTLTAFPQSPPHQLFLGGSPDRADAQTNSSMADVHIYPFALTTAEALFITAGAF